MTMSKYLHNNLKELRTQLCMHYTNFPRYERTIIDIVF